MSSDLDRAYFKTLETLWQGGNVIRVAEEISLAETGRMVKGYPALVDLQRRISGYPHLEAEGLKTLIGRFFFELRAVTNKPSIFIVHGWDAQLKLEAKNYLQNTLGCDCIVLHEKSSDGDTIIEKFERYAAMSTIAVVLLSESDEDSPEYSFAPIEEPRRPRPNVLFEMGYFFAKLGRKKVLLLVKGAVEIHSDILGIESIDVSHGVEQAGESIRRRLEWLF